VKIVGITSPINKIKYIRFIIFLESLRRREKNIYFRNIRNSQRATVRTTTAAWVLSFKPGIEDSPELLLLESVLRTKPTSVKILSPRKNEAL